MTELLKAFRWVVVGRPGCGYCDKAKDLLNKNEIPFTYLDLTEYPDLAVFLKANGFETVPQVFANGSNVGGFRETKDVIQVHGGVV